MSRPPKVALLIETARGYGRDVLRGVARYSRTYGPWRFYLTPGDFEQVVPKIREWRGDGIIARVLDAEMAETLLSTNLPVVMLDFSIANLPVKGNRAKFCADLTSDSTGAAYMAARCLLEKKLVNFAFVGYPFQSWSAKREVAFTNAIREAGYATHAYRPPLRFGRALPWESEEPILRKWLKQLPKPIGIMACNDQRGREVLDACESAQIRAPEEVAVVGVDADELFCELCSPPLTSVALNSEKGGFLAAKTLDEMMKGVEPEVKHILVEPVGVVERRSSNIVLVDDEDVAEALRIIHTERLENLTVDRVARNITISRRQLEVKFRRHIGRTMLEELQLVRIERAKQMLRETDASVEKIAQLIGFSAAGSFYQTFRSRVGVTPARYRREIRAE